MNLSHQFFSLKGEQIHQIQKLVKYKDYPIKIGSQIFYYCKEQLAFLSVNAFDHFESNSTPFEISIDQFENTTNVSMDDLISAFNLLDSLFHSQIEIEINQNNIFSFFLLGKILDNTALILKCQKCLPGKPQNFSITITALKADISILDFPYERGVPLAVKYLIAVSFWTSRRMNLNNHELRKETNRGWIGGRLFASFHNRTAQLLSSIERCKGPKFCQKMCEVDMFRNSWL
jgi:hypothetical protein